MTTAKALVLVIIIFKSCHRAAANIATGCMLHYGMQLATAPPVLMDMLLRKSKSAVIL